MTGAQRSLTVSAGIASFPHDAIDQDELMRRADAAMYRSKHDGRNRCETHRRAGAAGPPHDRVDAST